MEDFKKQITFEIDEYRFRIFVPSFCSAPTKRLLGRPDVNIPGQISARAEAFNGENEVARNTGILSSGNFFLRHDPRAPLHNHFSTVQSRHLRSRAKLKWVKPERDNPVPGKRTEIFARAPFSQGNVAISLIDINFCLRRRNDLPLRVGPLRRDKIIQSWKRIEHPNCGGCREIPGKKAEVKTWLAENSGRESL